MAVASTANAMDGFQTTNQARMEPTMHADPDMGEDTEFDTELGITVSIRQLIGAGIILGLGVVILNEVFTMDMLQNSSGPFSVATVTDPLGAALGIMGLALFVGGARVIMNQMGGGGGQGGL